MAATTTPMDRRARRMAVVDEHVRLENAHDLEGVIATFGDAARYDDEPWGAHYEGRDQVHQFYAQLMAALPDLSNRDRTAVCGVGDDCSGSGHSRHSIGLVARASGDRAAARDPTLWDLLLQFRRSPGGRTDLLRPSDGVTAAGSIS